MTFKINIEEFQKNYVKKDSLQHNVGSRITILPFTTQFKESKRPEITNFMAAVGEFSRGISYTKEPKDFNTEAYMQHIKDKVVMESKNKSIFLYLIKELFFTDDQLTSFHPKTLNYISSTTHNKKLGQFLLDTLFVEGEEIRQLINVAYHKDPDNILLKLMVNNLPDLQKKSQEKQEYTPLLPYISKLFMEDLKFMMKDSEFLTRSLEQLLKFYYLFYVSQLSMALHKTMEADINQPIDIYFALDWENTGKGRLNTEQGWVIVESNVLRLFSHAVTLDLINHHGQIHLYSYTDLKNIVDKLSVEEKKIFVHEIDNLTTVYQGYIKDVEWEGYRYKPTSQNECYEVVNKLFKSINYQFENSGRKERQKDYGTWFIEFCKENFLRQRGKYGYVLNLTEELTIFLTKLVIKDQDRIKLKDLFLEFKKRGISLDNDSKTKLIQLYEKLNILEKKSDSGDAQYVKAIL